MNTTTTRPQGVKLRVLDFTSALEAISFPVEEGETVGTAFNPYAAIDRPEGLYVVCNEGVGWKVTDEDPMDLDLYIEKADSISIFPSYRVRLTPDEVRQCMTDQEVDLADLIRTFGARLESNFWVLHRVLS